MSTAYIALGSNLGERRNTILRAIDMCKEKGIAVINVSSLIEADPAGGPPQEKFINGVMEVETDRSPQELLSILLEIEKSLGRVRSIKNGPRTIDLDILLYDEINLESEELVIPHPRMLERDFVMKPLEEIAPHKMRKIRNDYN